MLWDMRPQGTPQQLEKRRRHAIQLLQDGVHLSAVARFPAASQSSYSRWAHAYEEHGMTGLRLIPIPGRPTRLSPGQKATLVSLLLQGPLAHGYRTELWTLQRIARPIWTRFRIRYHPNHVWRVLRGVDWSAQKPERRALQRDDAAIAHWKRHRWPHIRKRRPPGGPSGLPR